MVINYFEYSQADDNDGGGKGNENGEKQWQHGKFERFSRFEGSGQ